MRCMGACMEGGQQNEGVCLSTCSLVREAVQLEGFAVDFWGGVVGILGMRVYL